MKCAECKWFLPNEEPEYFFWDGFCSNKSVLAMCDIDIMGGVLKDFGCILFERKEADK